MTADPPPVAPTPEPSHRVYPAVFLTVAALVGFFLYRIAAPLLQPGSAWGESIWAAAGFGLLFLVVLVAVHARFRIPFWRSEWLLLLLLPAAWVGLCWHGFWELTGKKNPNVPGYWLVMAAWLGYRNELKAALLAGRVRTWILTAVFCATTFLSGAIFLIWFPFSFSWIPILLLSVIAMVAIDGPKSEAPRRARPGLAVAIALVLVLVGGGVAAHVLRGPTTGESVRAFLGSTDAQVALAWRYRQGNGVAQDYARAAVLFERAAKSGSVRAQYDLGILHYYGLGGTDDQSRRWLEAAAQRDYGPAVTMLGVLERRQGNPSQALEHWRRAAALRDPFGEYLLGTAYLEMSTWIANTESDTERHLVRALYWLEKARRHGVNPVGGLLPQVWGTVPEESAERLAAAVFRNVEEGREP